MLLLEAPVSCARPEVPSCPSKLLPHAHTLPSSSRARLAATTTNISQLHFVVLPLRCDIELAGTVEHPDLSLIH